MGLKQKIGNYLSEGFKKVKSILPNSELKKTESALEQRLRLLSGRKFPAKEDAFFLLDKADFYEKTDNYVLFNKIVYQFADYLVNVRPSMALPLIELPKLSGFEKMKERFPRETFDSISMYMKASCYCLFSNDENIKADDILRCISVIKSHKQYLNNNDINEYVLKKIDEQCKQLEKLIDKEGDSKKAIHYARKIDTGLQCMDMLLPGYEEFAKYVAKTYTNVNSLINSGKL
ncbi:hypothetical protein KY312_00965 [Candidatus Woesearchaeota archaeon]|nr:hypothetical protein [Candidatus Woesearchaeota archaeon]